MAGEPSTLTDPYGALLTTTLRNMQPKIHDNIGKGNRFLAWLDMKGRKRSVSGGERIKVGLMYGLNTTADIYSGYGVLDTTPQDGITSAFFEWAQMSVSIAISRKEERQNSGTSQIISLLQTKIDQAEITAKELQNSSIVSGRITSSSNLGQFLPRIGRLDSGAVGPQPIPALIDANPARSVSIGNINGNTHAWWQNQATSSVATTFAGMRQEMGKVYNNCSKGIAGSPNLLLGDQIAFETYFNGLEAKERYLVTDKRTIDVLGGVDGSDDLIKFRGAVFIWDEITPDVETNAIVETIGQAAVGTMTASNIWFINSNAMDFVVDSETDWITTPMLRPENQDARVGQILWMGNVGVKNRRKNGVLYGISQSITA